MRIEIIIQLIILIFLSGCQVPPNNFKYEKRFLEGLTKAKEMNKPVFVYFTGYGCMGHDEFKNDLITSKLVQNKLNEKYVSVVLYVDDKQEIVELDTLNLKAVGFTEKGWDRVKASKTKGNVNSAIEIELFKSNTQPLYAVLNSDNKILLEPFGYVSKNKESFLSKLEKGIENFENQSTKILESDTVEIVLEYYGMMCDCPQWISPENKLIYEKNIKLGNRISEDSVFVTDLSQVKS